MRDAYVRKLSTWTARRPRLGVPRALGRADQRAGHDTDERASAGHLHHDRPARRAAARDAASAAAGARGGALRADRGRRRRRALRGAVADGAAPRAPPAGARRRRGAGPARPARPGGFVANHSHIVAVQIDEASIGRLAAAARCVSTRWSSCCRTAASRSSASRGWSTKLNQRSSHAPGPDRAAEIVENSCLLVMGSEGRGEQILKTDQDNALLLRDGFEHPQLAAVAQRFNEALIAFGYPPCPGQHHADQPAVAPASPVALSRTLRDWLYGELPDGRCTWRSSRRRGRWPATPRCWPEPRAPAEDAWPAAMPSWRASPPRPSTSSTSRRAGGRAHRARRERRWT